MNGMNGCSMRSVASSRNFANKIWNAFNVFGQFMEEGTTYRRERTFEELTLVERWMTSRVQQTIAQVEASMSRYRLSEAVLALYDLFWRDYCDWYLELIKPEPGEPMSDETIALAVELYEGMMQLLHPFMPFITEELWHRLRPRAAGEACIASSWPAHVPAHEDARALRLFELMQELVGGVRSVKASYGVAPSKDVSAVVSLSSSQADLVEPLRAHAAYFARLTRASVEIAVDAPRPPASATVVAGRAQVFVPLAGMIDLDAERERLTREIEGKQQFLVSVERKLANEQFTARAPEAVVEKERQKARDAQAEIDQLEASRAELGDREG
jgi:valyl-tRNA synthetase